VSRIRYFGGRIALVFILFAIAAQRSAEAASEPKFKIVASDRTLGSPRAPVTLIEYAAPSCPICARFNAEVFPLLKQSFIDTGKVYYVLRVFPISDADGAAEGIARCLPADGYFRFIDLLFRSQPQWDPEFGVTDVRGALLQMGRTAGVDEPRADECMADKAQAQRINEVAQDAVDRYGVRGTPTFVIDGVAQTPGYIPWPNLKQTLDALLQKGSK
jgi:protein-disulfide isomerase